MTGAHPNTKTTRQCVDCPAKITAYGNRKRCVECQEQNRLERARISKRKSK